MDALSGLCPACLLQMGAGPETVTAPGGEGFVPPSVDNLDALFPGLDILELIGKGGMGAVYKARQRELDRLVALKILPPGSGHSPAFAERFTREARALARLNHPGIVTLYEFGHVDGESPLYFFLMEFVDGVNLRQLLGQGRISAREALAIAPQICDALQYAHDQGIVHRDIKPENILMDRRGRVKVADFGLAKIVGTDESGFFEQPEEPSGGLTAMGVVMGTPRYMAPEQTIAPSEVDHRTDIYALGVVFYQMLTGELPGQQIEPPSKKVRLDVRLDEVVLRALEEKPERRYQQASLFKTQVESIAAGGAPISGASYEYRSRMSLFGLPLLHIAEGKNPVTGRALIARGIVAIGGIAQGVIAIGGVAMGGIAFGGAAVGLLAFGGLSMGLISIGGLALALLLAHGGLAVAPVAIGGMALGYFVNAGQGYGLHVWSSAIRDPGAVSLFKQPWFSSLQPFLELSNSLWVVVFGFGMGALVWLRSRRNLREK